MYKIFNIFLVILVTSLFSLSLHVNAGSIEEYRNDAKAFCDIYDTNTWKHLPKDASKYDVVAVIKLESENRLKTDDFKLAVSGAKENSIIRYYRAVKSRVSLLVAEEWECNNFDDFFLPEIDLIPVVLDEVKTQRMDPFDKSKLYVELLENELILIDRKPLKEFNADFVRKAIQLKVEKQGALELIVLIEKSVDYVKVKEFLTVLNELKIRNFFLVNN